MAVIAAHRDVLSELYDDAIAFITPLDAAALAWKPPAEEANSIAALVKHIAGSMDAWLKRAVDDPIVRDREAEFRYQDDAAGLVAILQASKQASFALLDRLVDVDPSATRRHTRVSHGGGETEISAAWCLDHAIAHFAEHWGHIQLTAQLHAAGVR
jgi:uncharacterized damage-inducible protein DinB